MILDEIIERTKADLEIRKKEITLDLLGRTLKELTYLDMESQKNVDVSRMVTGIYLVKITTNDMETTKQLIIK